MGKHTDLPALRVGERAGRLSAQKYAVSLPRERVCEAIFRQDRNAHAIVESRLPDMGHCHLSHADFPEGCEQHETPS